MNDAVLGADETERGRERETLERERERERWRGLAVGVWGFEKMKTLCGRIKLFGG